MVGIYPACRRTTAMLTLTRAKVLFIVAVVSYVFVILLLQPGFQNLSPRGLFFSSRTLEPPPPAVPGVAREWWVVVHSPSPSSAFLPTLIRSLPSWGVVVVGDHDLQEDCRAPQCVFLGSRAVTHLKSQAAGLLTGSGGRATRLLGYLYALRHGAKVVLETDTDREVTGSLQQFMLEANFTGLVYAGGKMFNPYVHFGQGTAWPRGFPLSDVSSPQPSKYMLFTWPVPLIQHSLVTGDVDVDDTFRMTRVKDGAILSMTFDPQTPPVALAPGTFAPFGSSSTLLHQGALWAAVLPMSGSPATRDVTRAYWAQRLLWEIGGSTGFVQPGAFRKLAFPRTRVEMSQAEFFPFLPRLLDRLRQWACPPKLPFFQCVLDLSKEMAALGVWSNDDVTLVEAWLKDLEATGYKPPARVLDPGNFTQEALEQIFDGKPLTGNLPYDRETRMSRVIFHPKEMGSPLLDLDLRTEMADARQLQHLRSLQRLCRNVSFHVYEEEEWQQGAKPRTLLVVEFNHPYYEALPHLERNSRQRFPTTLYCGDNITKFLQNQAKLPRPVSFVEASLHTGFYGYECMVHAVDLGYREVEAYFYVSEDVLLRPWNIPPALHDLTWYPAFSALNVTNRQWTWWGTAMGMEAYHRMLDELQSLAQRDAGVRRLWEKMQANLRPFTPLGLTKQGVVGCADVYQVGRKDAQDFALVAAIARKHGVFLEIGAPFAAVGLFGNDTSRVVKGTWGKTATTANKALAWQHPTKWRLTLKDPNSVDFLCQHYFPMVARP